MKRLKTKHYKEVKDWSQRIARFNGKGNIIPHEANVSKNRGAMFGNNTAQFVPIKHGETPIVNTIYEYDILQSTKNVFADNDKKVIKIINKTLGGQDSGVQTIVVQDMVTEEFQLFEYSPYQETGAGCGVGIISDVSVKGEGAIIESGESLFRTSSYGEDLVYNWGTNALTALAIDVKSIEDAGLISSKLAEKMTNWKYQEYEEVIDLNNDVLRNIYGDTNTYKPFPMVGEEVQNDVLMVVGKNQRNHQYIDTNFGFQAISKLDTKIFGKGKVVDITVRLKDGEECQNAYLNALLREQRKYDLEILETLETIVSSGAKCNNDLIDTYNKLVMIYIKKSGFELKKILSPSSVVLKITLVKENAPTEGQKITGRCGNKFTISTVFPDGLYYTKYGNLEYLGNSLASFNRSIMAVFLETFENYLTMIFSEIVSSGSYDDNTLKEIILGTLKIMDMNMYENYKLEFDTEEGWKEFKKEPTLYWYLDTYNSVDIKKAYLARNFLKENGIQIERTPLYKKTEYGDKLIGSVFVSKLFIAPLKQVADSQLSLRAKGSYDLQGIIKRSDTSKYRDTPVRKSTLVADIQSNTLHPDDLERMNGATEQESIQLVQAYMKILGLTLDGADK